MLNQVHKFKLPMQKSWVSFANNLDTIQSYKKP